MGKSFEHNGIGAGVFGEHLRREREMRGISLDDIAAATKIGTRLLRALEDEQFDLLPGGIFNKGYVRAYARFVGIDEEQAVAEYLNAASETDPDVRLIAHQNSSTHRDSGQYGAVYRRGFPFVPVMILLLVVMGAMSGWHLYRQRQREVPRPVTEHDVAVARSGVSNPTAQSSSNGTLAPAQTGTVPSVSGSQDASVPQVPANAMSSAHGAVQTVEAAENASHPSDSDASSGENAAGSEVGAQFEVMVRAKNHARVEIKSDGKVSFRGIMSPSDVKTVRATNKVVFWTANAGDVEISFNGKPVPLNNGANDEQVLVFNSHGLVPRSTAQ